MSCTLLFGYQHCFSECLKASADGQLRHSAWCCSLGSIQNEEIYKVSPFCTSYITLERSHSPGHRLASMSDASAEHAAGLSVEEEMKGFDYESALWINADSLNKDFIPRPVSTLPSFESVKQLKVQCMVRALLTTPFGPAFLHVYVNNRDQKEHLALVFDHEQLQLGAEQSSGIRSRSLDDTWSDKETNLHRIVRGAYLNKLDPAWQVPSAPVTPQFWTCTPLVRIQSECFTGETLLNGRCDCRTQVDEALRALSTPPSTDGKAQGILIYLRQEGRDIGIISKLRAYNLQDYGFDDVTANILLGHGADDRLYDDAAAILHDLSATKIKLMTSQQSKVDELKQYGIDVADTVPFGPFN
jgi:GTP cyclohydrolase II